MIFLMLAAVALPFTINTHTSSPDFVSDALRQLISGQQPYNEIITKTDELIDQLRVECVIHDYSLPMEVGAVIYQLEEDLQNLYTTAYDLQNGYDSSNCARKGHWTTAALLSSALLAGYMYYAQPVAKTCSSPQFDDLAYQLQSMGYGIYDYTSYGLYDTPSVQKRLSVSLPIPAHVTAPELVNQLQDAWATKTYGSGCQDPLKAGLIMATMITWAGALASWCNSASTTHISAQIARCELILQRLAGWLDTLERQAPAAN